MPKQIDLFEDEETLDYLSKNVPIPDDDKAAMLANLASHYETAEDGIAQLEKDLATAKEWFRRIREDLIPEKMIELGVKKMVLTDGSVISYSDFYAGKVINDEAYDWLEANGYPDAVKVELKLETSRIDKALLDKIRDFVLRLGSENLSAKEKQSIHHMTLGAAIKSLTKQGKELPPNLIETFIGKRATLKRGKDNG